jgi:uroporphyrinogen decarboxylase
MISRQRVLSALHRSEPDRVPINYLANPGIDQRLKEHFGLAANDGEGLRRRLGVDFRGIGVPYVGPRLHEDIPESGIRVDMWGIHRRWVEHDSGGYWDFCDFPLEHADEEAVAGWPMPSPDDFDYSVAARASESCGEMAVFVGGAGLPDILNGNGFLRGVEQTLVDMVTDDPAGLLLAERRTAIQLEVIARTIEAAKDRVDFVWMGEDLGTQHAPLIGLDLFRRRIRPLHQRVIDLAKSYSLPTMIHSCGSSSWAFDDFAEMGIDAVDTLQPEAANMSPEYLKSTFGDRLAFHGCISTAGPVSFGTPDEVIADCRRTLDIMMPGGGYCFAPTHQLQDNSPVENVVAMYETALQYGSYR